MAQVAEKAGITKAQADAAVAAFTETVIEAVEGEAHCRHLNITFEGVHRCV